jgi:hypothetical protein
MYYIEPEEKKMIIVKPNTIGIIVEDCGGFVWFSSPHGTYQAQKKHLRIIGTTTPEDYFGYKVVEWDNIVGDGHGIWLDKGLMHLGEREDI